MRQVCIIVPPLTIPYATHTNSLVVACIKAMERVTVLLCVNMSGSDKKTSHNWEK